MMPVRDFDALVFAYLDGDASEQQTLALRDALRSEPALRSRLAALVRLHRAQSAALVRSRPSPYAAALAGLRHFADRAGRCLAYACVLALVVVELEVAVPGVDSQAWLSPEPAPSADATPLMSDDMLAPDDMSPVEDDVAPLPDVREADFLDS